VTGKLRSALNAALPLSTVLVNFLTEACA